jgi:hypothetical protein
MQHGYGGPSAHTQLHAMVCQSCGAMGPWCVNESDAVERWERRIDNQPENAKLDIDTDARPLRETRDRAEIAWLIETKSKPSMWWTGFPDFDSWEAWGTANQAIRFARKEDAEQCAIRQGALTSDFVATSHEWI